MEVDRQELSAADRHYSPTRDIGLRERAQKAAAQIDERSALRKLETSSQEVERRVPLPPTGPANERKDDRGPRRGVEKVRAIYFLVLIVKVSSPAKT